MKKSIISCLAIIVLSCSQNQSTHTEVAQLVVESFYKKDNTELKKYTTPKSYDSFISIQDLMTKNENGASDFSVIEETIDGETAWVKFTTSYEEKPEAFKLIKVDGNWKVTEKGLREKSPF